VSSTLHAIDAEEAVAVSGDHPLVAHLCAYPATDLLSWRYGEAVAVSYHYWNHPSLTACGPPADVASLLLGIGASVRSWVSVPDEVLPLLPRGFLLDMHGWEFRWTYRRTGTPRDAATWLAADDEHELRTLLATAFPDASVGWGSPRARRWAGIRDHRGRLVACAADATGRQGTGFVASITTDPQLRGTGLGRRVTGWLVDRLVDEHGRAALWVNGDNGPARAVYDRLTMLALPLTAGALPAAHDLVTADTARTGDESGETAGAAVVPVD
jgi:GNAT superfamily N-acetyltransferase